MTHPKVIAAPVLMTVALAMPAFAQQSGGLAERIEEALRRNDKDQDGRLSRVEYPQPAVFDRVDANGDGFVNREEALRYYSARFRGRSKLAPPQASSQKPQIAEDSLFRRAEIPGLTDKDIDLKIEDNILTLSSRKDEAGEEKKDGYLIRERRSAEFCRTFVLPKDVNRDQIKAEFENGLLVVTLPKAPEAKPRKIDVKVNG